MDYAYHDYEHTLYRIKKNRTILYFMNRVSDLPVHFPRWTGRQTYRFKNRTFLYFSVIFRMIGLDYLLFYAKMNIVHLKG